MLPTLPSNRDTLFPQPSSRYRPLGQIGRGGMAEVILAQMSDGPGGATLAVLKRIWPHLACEPAFMSLFRHEARVSAALSHPNIVKTYELLETPEGAPSAEDTERPAIAMEYLDGQPLARVLNRLVGPDALSITLRIRIVGKVLAALHHAHELTDERGLPYGIVHRDVNPQNVFITYSGAVKLVDFGVAKSLSRVDPGRPRSAPGKVAYMAPEQLAGAAGGGGGDRRADIFSVGVMLWEMVAGRRLWEGMTEETIIRHLGQRIPAPALVTSAPLSGGLGKIIARALAYDPERRYATAAAFAEALQPLLPGSDDAHGRRLGHVVSLAFAKERAARKDLIDRSIAAPRAASSPAILRLTHGALAGLRPRLQPRPRVQGSLAPPPPPPPAYASLRAPRSTPGGAWSLNEPTPSNPEAAVQEGWPLGHASGASTRARGRSSLTTLVGHRWPTARWAALAGALAAATLILGVTLHLKDGALVRVSTLSAHSADSPDSPLSTAAMPRSAPMNTIVVAPLRGRSVIPWPLPAVPSSGQPAHDGANVGASVTSSPDPMPRAASRHSLRSLGSGPAGKQGSGSPHRGAGPSADQPADSAGRPAPWSDDNVLAPTIDLTIEEIADTAADEKGGVPADVEADLAHDLGAAHPGPRPSASRRPRQTRLAR